MAEEKFSEFASGGAVQQTDTIVGLRSGVNTKFDASTGDVVGPVSASDSHVALFNGATGKLLKDGGALPTGNVAGPGSSTPGNVAIFSDGTGKVIADGGAFPTGNVDGPVSATDGNLAVFDGITGKLIKDGGPVPPTGGFIKVYVSTGYQLVAPNTIYYTTDAPGKTFFQIPATFPKGSTFQIVGGSQLSLGWELWTQLNQSLIYQDVITDLASNIYAVAQSSYYRDCAIFTCITDNLEVQCIQYEGSGLSISEEISIDIPLTTVASSPRIVYAFGKIISGYTGYLAKLIRQSDSAIAYASPDFANRLSQLSNLDIGGKVADFSADSAVTIEMLDQSGNGNDATNSGAALWLDGSGNASNINSRNAFQTSAGGNYLQAALPFFSDPTLTIFSLGTIYADSSGSSMALLYSTVNGDDYSSALNSISFYTRDNTQIVSYRNADLSTKLIPGDNIRMVLSDVFDNTNNTLSINGVDGTVVPSTGSFGFNKLLIGGRYVSGGITSLGNYKVACMILYPTGLSSGDVTLVHDYIDFYL